VSKSASGIDGLSPQHIKDIISLSASEGGNQALESITNLCNKMLSGTINEDACKFIYGASLCDGGIRPIAIGCFLGDWYLN